MVPLHNGRAFDSINKLIEMVMMKNLTLQPIGIAHSPFNKPDGTPIQPAGAVGVSGNFILRSEFEEALQDLEDFSHIILLNYFHLSED